MRAGLEPAQPDRREHSPASRDRAADMTSLLGGMNHLTTPSPDPGHVWHLYPVAIDFEAVGKTRGKVMKELAARGIGTQVHYIPLNRQPYYKSVANGVTPGADTYYQHTLSIPMYPRSRTPDIVTISADNPRRADRTDC